MALTAKNGTVRFEDGEMEYIRFGTGEKVLILLPGLGDGLRTVKGTALPMGVMYRKLAQDYTVYSFSRRNCLKDGFTTREMARDQAMAMDILGIKTADVVGVSMGGMIAQFLAADYPEKVRKLVLVVTCARPNKIIETVVAEWITQAKQDDHTALMDSNIRLIYSDAYYQKNKKLIPLMGKLTKPKSYDRFLIQAEACRKHDSYDLLGSVTAPTLVMGGEQDKCLGSEASREIAGKIPGAQLKLYPQWGHGLYEEAEDFQDVILEFLRR